ncbi:Calcium-binding EF-hand family protein [Rhynchospora pubera]|uniref:Calcium-binding EF-hand family protein n=1 Tax=Rhynchospora pubera TaxID=906938 RepID=A0AAV8EBY5_9POAL|nr:Calcium-binding EF-hand family protein [Rhynchospora pubera]
MEAYNYNAYLSSSSSSNQIQIQSTAPSAPPLHYSSYNYSTTTNPSPYPQQQQQQQGGYYSVGGGAQPYYYAAAAAFPPGTNPEVISSFQAVDRDRSGSIDERELQSALSSVYRGFGIRTVRLLLFLFRNPRGPSDRIGPAEFAVLWNCLGQWRMVFDRFDKDRSGKIDSEELKEALRSLGYAVPPSVLQIIMSNYTDSISSRGALNFDNFVECGMIVKGITDKFKEKDARYSGSATFTYESFLTTIIPFIVP